MGIFIALMLLAPLAGQPQTVVLVENGRPRAAIVTGERASEAVGFAARELKTYLEKISGAALPIRARPGAADEHLIFLGDGEPAKGLAPEGFRIKSGHGNLYLAGRDDAGTQFAVYTFLEKYLGVRWFWPGDLGEVVPRQATISIGAIDETQQPDFKWRDRGPGGALWGATSGPTGMRARERLLGVTAENQAEVGLWEKRNRWGGLKIYGGHALGEIFPPEKYARAHPEYYALVNGKREAPGPDYDYKHRGQVCTSNPEVVRVTVEWVRTFFDGHPGCDGVHITMNDGGGFCECERCRALDSGEPIRRAGIEADEMKTDAARTTSISDRIFTFVNQVAEQVVKTHPGKYVVSMAYSRYILPPNKITLRANVVPQYCLWSAYRHANPALKLEHETIAAAWARAARRVGIYEYFINGSWPGMHRLVTPYVAESIRFLHRQGIDLYQLQSGDDFAVNGINYYVAGKLLWDTSLDENRVLEDFYGRAFGGAAPAVKRFHQRLREAWTDATRDGRDVTCSSLEDTRLPELFTPDLLEKAAEDLREAARLAAADAIRRRVDFYRQGLRYTELTVAAVRAARRVDVLRKGAADRLERLPPAERARQRKLVAEALAAWEERDRFVARHKSDHVLAYFWVQYHNTQRNFHPAARLRDIARRLNAR